MDYSHSYLIVLVNTYFPLMITILSLQLRKDGSNDGNGSSQLLLRCELDVEPVVRVLNNIDNLITNITIREVDFLPPIMLNPRKDAAGFS